jgi:hypothetical protein
MNGHLLASQTMSSTERLAAFLGPQKPTVVRMELDVPVAALSPDGLQALDLEFSSTAAREAVRLHRIELGPPRCATPAAP